MADHSEVEPIDDQNDDPESDDAVLEDDDLDENDSDDEAEDDPNDVEIEEEAAEEEEASNNTPSAGSIDTDDLNVKICFNLGYGMISIADLRAVAPGYVFNLENEQGAEVAVIAGGREIGRGEIVQIAERLGVRIVQLKGGADAQSS